MRTYILFFIVFLLSFSAYSQTGGGMRRGGQSGSGRGTGTQTMGTEAQRTGQRPAEGVKGKDRRQGGNCNPGARGTGIDAGGTTGTGVRTRTRTGIGTRTGNGTKVSQPNIRTNIRVNNGVRIF